MRYVSPAPIRLDVPIAHLNNQSCADLLRARLLRNLVHVFDGFSQFILFFFSFLVYHRRRRKIGRKLRQDVRQKLEILPKRIFESSRGVRFLYRRNDFQPTREIFSRLFKEPIEFFILMFLVVFSII